MPEGCCKKIHQKIHIDSLIDIISINCGKIERLEIRWDPETLRFSDKSNKAVGQSINFLNQFSQIRAYKTHFWCNFFLVFRFNSNEMPSTKMSLFE